MPTSQLDFVAFTPEHLDGALRLSREAGWPHRREDWADVLALSTGFVALDGDRVAGTAMVTRYGADAAAINLVIVDAGLRGRGIGRKLMDLAVREAGDRSCQLTATLDGVPLYESLGFRPVGEIAQHQGPLGDIAPGAGVGWSGADAAEAIVALDRTATGMDRAPLIRMLLEQGEAATLRRDPDVAGFAVLRRFGRGEVAGPVVAGTPADARALLAFLFAGRRGAFMRVDIPVASGLGPWLTEQGLACVDTGVTMRRGGHEARGTTVRTFALASQALG